MEADRRERASLGGSVCPKWWCSVRVVHGLHLVALDMHCNSGLKSPKGIWYFKPNLQLLGLLKDNFTFDAGFSLTAQTSSIISPSFKSRLCSSILSCRFESDFYQTTSSVSSLLPSFTMSLPLNSQWLKSFLILSLFPTPFLLLSAGHLMPAHVLLEMEPQASHRLKKMLITEPTPQPLWWSLWHCSLDSSIFGSLTWPKLIIAFFLILTWQACMFVLPICLLRDFSLCSSSSLPIKYWGSDLWFLVFSVFTQFLDNVIAFISRLFLLTCRFILRPPLSWPPCLCIHGLCCLWRATKSLTNINWSSFHAVHLHSAAFHVGQHDPANSGQQP